MISIRDAGSTYLLTFRNGKRLNPRTSMSSIWHVNFFCTVVAIWNYFRSNMYGSATSEPSSEQGRRKLTSHWSSRWINQFSCQFLMDCFVHERCIPQQNSQWCFWASVWRSCAWQIVCVIDSVWQSCVWKIACDTVSRWKIVRDKVMCERLRVCVWRSCAWKIVCVW